MKDLYKLLHLETDASVEAIETAARDSGHSEAAAAVLLQADRRDAYDHCHATLTAIGNLRKRLGLDDADSWFKNECGDFIPHKRPAAPPAAVATEAEVIEEAMETEDEPVIRRGLNWPVLLVIAVGLAIAAWAILR